MGVLGRGHWWQRGWFNPVSAERDLAASRADARGHQIHFWCCLFLCFFTPWMTTATEWAGLPLIVFTAIRLRTSLRAARWSMALPQYGLIVAFCAWQWLSLLWSPDVHEGIKQAGATRWLWFYPLLFLSLDRRRALILALVAGFLAGNYSQLLHVVGMHFHIPAITWNRFPDRNSGWWDPVVGGSLLTAALGLSLPATLLASARRDRIRGAALSLITLIAIFATGTRGAWIASAGLIGFFALVVLLRSIDQARAKGVQSGKATGSLSPPALAAAFVLVLGILLGGLFFGPTIRARVQQAAHDLTAAVEGKNFNTDTGSRVLMALWAGQALREHPVRGVGVGGFRSWSVEHLKQQNIDPTKRSTHAHAHNALLHVGATTGIVGLALAVLVIVKGLQNAWRAGVVEVNRFPSSLGPFFALVGLLLVSAFDTIHVNAQTSALLCLLLALSPGWIPGAAGAVGRGARSDDTLEAHAGTGSA